jgi:hypothetical protein
VQEGVAAGPRQPELQLVQDDALHAQDIVRLQGPQHSTACTTTRQKCTCKRVFVALVLQQAGISCLMSFTATGVTCLERGRCAAAGVTAKVVCLLAALHESMRKAISWDCEVPLQHDSCHADTLLQLLLALLMCVLAQPSTCTHLEVVGGHCTQLLHGWLGHLQARGRHIRQPSESRVTRCTCLCCNWSDHLIS